MLVRTTKGDRLHRPWRRAASLPGWGARETRVTPRRDFFLIVSPEYRTLGAPPVEWWLDAFCKYRQQPYYLGLLLFRAMVAIFSDKFLSGQLAIRGGTVLHKVHLAPAARYSEDVDLVLVGDRPEAHIEKALNRVLRPLFGSEKSSVPGIREGREAGCNTQVYLVG